MKDPGSATPRQYSAPSAAPDVERALERLDDVIFPAIEGDAEALSAAESTWHETVARLGRDAVAETRSQYLRYALSTWQFLKRQTVQQPLRTLAVMKIISMLAGEDW